MGNGAENMMPCRPCESCHLQATLGLDIRPLDVQRRWDQAGSPARPGFDTPIQLLSKPGVAACHTLALSGSRLLCWGVGEIAIADVKLMISSVIFESIAVAVGAVMIDKVIAMVGNGHNLTLGLARQKLVARIQHCLHDLSQNVGGHDGKAKSGFLV